MISDKTRKLQEREDFIKKYKAAIKAGLSREQLATYMEVKPDSLLRRRLVIKDTVGLDLPYLKSDPKPISEEKLKTFRTELGKLTKENNKESAINATVDKNDFSNYDRIIITSAQNSTPIKDNFFASLLTYQKYFPRTALKIIPYRYKNPTSIFQDSDAEYWDDKVVPYLLDQQVKIFDNLQIMGHIKKQPTATNPVNGYESYTGTDSAIIGHPKIQLKTVPTPSNTLPKILTSTGAVTLPNYTDSDAGHKGAFHHSYGAVIVELDRKNKIFHLRHIHGNKEDGSFYDVAEGVLRKFTAHSVEQGERLSVVVTGDTHAIYHDPTVEEATYTGKDSIFKRLKPKHHFLHDLNDCASISHHDKDKPTIKVGKHRFGRNNLEKELQIAADLLDRITADDMKTYIVKSNHDEHMDRWLENLESPKHDPENSQFFYWLRYNKEKSLAPTRTGFESIDLFEFWCKYPDQERGLKHFDRVKFIKRDESIVINNIEFSFHGDRGASGARGSLPAFSQSGHKMVVGHSHRPGIYESVYQVGLSAYLNLDYKSGLDAWLHTHCLVYPDGKRSLVNVIKGKWFL